MEPRVALITNDELMGSRWNGLDLLEGMRARGVDASLFVQKKHTDDPDVVPVGHFKGRDRIGLMARRLEHGLSMQSVFFPWGAWLKRQPRFQQANIVHLHIFHMEYLSVPMLPWLARDKQLLITLHDAWPLTGHCVHPSGCERLRSGCGECPQLHIPFAMKTDRTAMMMRIKTRAYAATHAHLHVTTEYMKRLALLSSATAGLGVTKIPLGIDVDTFNPGDKDAARSALGLRADAGLVIGLRATHIHWKGLPLALAALRIAAEHIPLTVVTFQEKGLLDELKPQVRVVDLGWVNDSTPLVQAYQAMDLFLMPSSHESFGFMALEAMACGVPPVVFEGTTMQEILQDERTGYLAPAGDAAALAQAFISAYRDQADRQARSTQARNRAVQTFSRQQYDDDMLALYRRLLDQPAEPRSKA